MIQVVKQGLLDTVQDAGRYGYQHLGINPGGAMDRIALSVANSLVGNDPADAVIEMHFPASAFLFETEALIALSGGDFGAMVNDLPVSINKPVLLSQNSVLRFTKPVSGARCYLAIHGGLALESWLNSYSTHLKAGAGGFLGRQLQKNDRLPFREVNNYSRLLQSSDIRILPWRADIRGLYTDANNIHVIPGSEWPVLTEDSQTSLIEKGFSLTEQCDRMGFRLKGPALHTRNKDERLSAGVSKGTIQLLPNGQLIILMADHQTTGGYGRVAHVTTADIPALSQLLPNQELHFSMVTPEMAATLFEKQELHLHILQNACKLRLQDYCITN
ncbi:antagonist of KipI [Chitinophaga sp. CF118]|uniref:5-oxoprolinase subunit C family protein n=1 Tax=Chitinophaga sp. CF118 TaxID=1884367 RepID=UPI0008EA9CF3|nr:biotin-dependent carboxyltransferase family protein [Chitinophaga sp. CF118]SFD23652.1 antagonist of KipI [Chitinophaga sp. CF118]